MVQRELALTMQEVAECRAQAELFELEANGFFGIEVLLFLYAILTMHVLIEEWYVPALELVTSPDVLDVPRPLLGCTIMAAGNCLPELSMSLVAMLLSGSPDVGTGEVFGSCVFDLLAILGVVCVRMPAPATPTAETPQLARPLMFYFLFWAALATAIDASLFYADLTAMWPLSILMVVLFVTFVVGVFVCNRLIPNFAAPDLSLPQILGGRRPWALTILLCILFTLMLSYAMVAIATRAVCLLGVRKNALGATVLCLSAGFPDLLTAMILVRRPGPGMVEMAAANPFGALLFNAFVALGLPWLILGTYADVFPPARGTWLPSLVGFVCIAIGLVLILAARLKLSRRLGYALLTLYALYVVAIVHDGTTRPARPPA